MSIVYVAAEFWPAWTALADALRDRPPPPCTVDPESWTSPRDDGEADVAAAGCRRCVAVLVCGDYAEQAGERGVWGGRWLR